MKKLILVLAILLAAPAFALDLELVREGNDVVVRYTGADTGNLPRGFALRITVDGGAAIDGISGYKTGESTAASPGYGIYPATIVIDSCGVVTNPGTPLADGADPGAGDQVMPSSSFVLEFGSLYYDVVNAPATDGNLCVLSVDCGTAMGDVNIVLTTESTYRGGVVLEDGTSGGTFTETLVYDECGCTMPVTASSPSPANDVTNVARTAVLSWTAGAGATAHRVYFGPNSPSEMIFKVEQSGTTFDPNTVGLMGQGKTFYWRIDEKNECGTTAGNVWKFTTEDCFSDTNLTEYNKWVLYSKPDCWCFKKQCRGDADGKLTLTKPVMSPDLTIFKAAFNKTPTVVKTIVVSGFPGICADFDHKDTLTKPVMSPDLTIFKFYFNDPNASVPQCDQAPIITAPVDFWMN